VNKMGDCKPVYDRNVAYTGTTYTSTIKDVRAALDWIKDNTVSVTSVSNALLLVEKSADPADPAEGKSVIWQSDGTGAGDDGDIMIKITAGGVTKTKTIVDFSV